jgi:puromycin-sensitive aminopeptidase
MGDRNFRLPTHVKPERYEFNVVPDLASKSFAATGSIALELTRPVREVTMHAVALSIESAVLGNQTAAVTYDAESQTVTFAVERPLETGRAQLDVSYTGKLHDDLRGFYLAGKVAVTQFEAADARRAFPCFDEPAFKATWSLSLEGDTGLAMISNGEVEGIDDLGNGRKRVMFRETPRMSSYLVAMVVGELQASPSRVNRWVAIRTWSVPEKAHLTAFGQECADAVLPLLEDYFGRKYAFGKLDQVGIPDFEAGAMENSGCVTFREVLLLVDPAKAALSVQKRAAEVITHELAHQWFGNLVTMVWWDDLWLNEAFATWMAYKIVDQWKPEWRMWDDFENGKHAALGLDAMASTHPIRTEVRNADEATENFDVITYEKGGAMLRMIEGYLGEDSFRDGIRAYMRKHAFANARADDLWDALAEASGVPVRDVANAWISKGGFPLVDVRRDGRKVSLAQRRYALDPATFAAGTDDLWPVPVVLKWADDAGVHETRHLLTGRTGEVTLDARGEVRFVLGNAKGAGFYRVAHTAAEVSALVRHFDALTPVEKVNLLSDAWAGYRAGAAALAPALELFAHAATDVDYAVLSEACARFDLLERRFTAASDKEALRARVALGFRPHLDAVKWDATAGESDDVKLRRAVAVRALVAGARDPAASREAAARYARWSGGEHAALDNNLLDVAALAAARLGGAPEFDAFLERAQADADPATKRRALVALASFESDALVARALETFLTDAVPRQDSTTFLAALLANPAARLPAWAFVQARWADVREKTAAPMLTRRLVESMGELFEQRAAVEAFVEGAKESLAAAPQAIRQTLERMGLDEELRRRAVPEVAAWLER